MIRKHSRNVEQETQNFLGTIDSLPGHGSPNHAYPGSSKQLLNPTHLNSLCYYFKDF